MQIVEDTIRGRLLSAIKALGIRFPTSEIAEKTGYKKATISEYLKTKEPSEAFVRTFCEQYKVDFGLIWRGVKPPAQDQSQHFTADQLFHMYMKAMERQDGIIATQTAILKNIENKMALEISLQETLAGVETIVDEHGPRLKKILSDLDELKKRKTVP